MKLFTTIFTILFFLIISSCTKVPVTGRKQLNLIPSSEMNAMSFSNYKQVLNKSKLSSNRAQTALIQKVGSRIKVAVHKYMQQNKMSHLLKGYKWEFNLIEDKTVNAWCMPGGKVAFYTGIMPICKDETGVAVVMGHEIAHAIAKHGNERMSQALLQQLGGVTLAVALRNKPQETQAIFMGAYGVGTSVGAMLPFSRLHESEADKMGLIFMAMAGYDPREAPKFWQRMQTQSGGASPPEFLSTHPSHSKRINDLQSQIPNAMKYYKKK